MIRAEWLLMLRGFIVAEIERWLETTPPPLELLSLWRQKMDLADLLDSFEFALEMFTAPIALAS